MANKQFKAESKRLLELMIHSIYTHKEIFLRELISNASDAIDKAYFRSLSSESAATNRSDYGVRLEADKTARTIKISDDGVGMTKEELESNLGIIANSGSLKFKQDIKEDAKAKEELDLIGQFGVGFYSAFMVSKKIVVQSKVAGAQAANEWASQGSDGYSIKECEKATVGTEITLYLLDDTDDEKYSDYLESYKLRSIVKKYSDYIRYPIKMQVEKTRAVEGEEGKTESYIEDETLNSMVPIWKKQKSELTKEDYDNFYADKHYGFDTPIKSIHTSSDGLCAFNALLYIPGETPFNFYTKEYEKGLELYSSGVMIMQHCKELIPDYFSFVKGLVDSDDLSLNISREMLQHSRQLNVIANHIKKKIKSELISLLESDREAYNKFFESFGKQLKYGLYSEYGMNKDLLQDLVMFYSSTEKKQVTLKEYVSRVQEAQDKIYYVSGESVEKLDKMPQTELLKDNGYEILYLVDEVDEFALKMLREYEGKAFASASSAELDSKEDTPKDETQKKEQTELFAFIKEALGSEVTDVVVSKRLKTHPVCLTSKGELSIEMEKVLSQMPGAEAPKAEKILEINEHHKVYELIKKYFETDKEKLKSYSKILYGQARLIEGLSLQDPVEFAELVCDALSAEK